MQPPELDANENARLEHASEQSTAWIDRNLASYKIDWKSPQATPFYTRQAATEAYMTNHHLEAVRKWLKLIATLLGVLIALGAIALFRSLF